jgi:hypothetical protein
MTGDRETLRAKTYGHIVWLALLSSCAGYTPGQKAYWDAKVKEMCEKDGGVTVYEVVHLTQSDYGNLAPDRSIAIPDERSPNKQNPYFARTVTQELNAENPRVVRRETEIIRRTDSKVLGKVIIYSRVGGDMPTGIAHESYFSCRDVSGVRLDIERQIFTVRVEGS